MTLISYAQNFEDVMLARALSSVENGVYVDIGAQNPVEHSVTKAFYDQGWSGINVEPVAEWHQLLCEQRPRDRNLNLGVGQQTGSLKFYSIEGTGLSTADKEIAERHESAGWKVTATTIQIKTLSEVIEESDVRDIHFLKVDVEGFERQVLEGGDFRRFRPWIVLVEATRPLSNEESHQAWEPLLTESDYQFVYFDGLNRFYVAKEHSDLVRHFSTPPNIFDDYIRYSEWQAHRAAERLPMLEVQLRQTERALVTTQSALEGSQHVADVERAAHNQVVIRLEGNIRDLEQHLGHKDEGYQREIAALRAGIDAIMNSTSWKITAPLRLSTRAVRSSLRLLSRITVLRRMLAGGLSPFPRLKGRVLALMGYANGSAVRNNAISKPDLVFSPGQLTDSAQAFVRLMGRTVESASGEGKPQ